MLALSSATAALPRKVYSFVEQPSGTPVYFAIMANGDLLNGEIRHRLDGETEDSIIRDLWKDLNKADPVTVRAQLTLYVDGEPRPR